MNIVCTLLRFVEAWYRSTGFIHNLQVSEAIRKDMAKQITGIHSYNPQETKHN